MTQHLDSQLVDGDSFASHDRVMYEYYEKNPPYEPDPAVLVRSEVGRLVARMRLVLAGTRVIEIACGSGWATRIVAEVAESVVATDLSPTRLVLARRRAAGSRRVRFAQADAYRLDAVEGVFNAALAIAWFAHVPKERHRMFIEGVHQRVGRGGKVFLADECFSLGPPVVIPGMRDEYERRQLGDGSRYSIIDNKFETSELERIFAPMAEDLEVHQGERYWWLHYTVS